MMAMGKKIKAHRKLKGYTQAHLARLTDSGITYIAALENETMEFRPSAVKLVKIADALDTSISYLLGESDTEETDQDLVFYHKYLQMPAARKKAFRQIVDIWVKHNAH